MHRKSLFRDFNFKVGIHVVEDGHFTPTATLRLLCLYDQGATEGEYRSEYRLEVDTAKFFGFNFDSDLNWDDHITQFVSKFPLGFTPQEKW